MADLQEKNEQQPRANQDQKTKDENVKKISAFIKEKGRNHSIVALGTNYGEIENILKNPQRITNERVIELSKKIN